jgi:hypothetical protein
MELCYFDSVIWAHIIIYMWWWDISGWTYLGFLAYYHDNSCYDLPGPVMVLIVGSIVTSD